MFYLPSIVTVSLVVLMFYR